MNLNELFFFKVFQCCKDINNKLKSGTHNENNCYGYHVSFTHENGIKKLIEKDRRREPISFSFFFKKLSYLINEENLKFNENEIEDMLEKVKLQMAKINTIKMMNLTKDNSEMKQFKEYLQKKLYFIELEWLIVGEVCGTPNNYQVMQNIRHLMENKYNTIKNNEIFNDEDPIGIKIKAIVDKKNSEKKVIFTPVEA